MSVWFFDSNHARPCDAIEFDPSNMDFWEELLSEPKVVALDDHGHKGTKNEAPALCGARYFPGVTTRVKENVDVVEALVLDVDCDETPVGRVPSAEDVDAALAGKYNAIIYSTSSHTKQKPHWRIVLPLKTPLAPKMCRALVEHLSKNLIPTHPGCIDADSTGDPGRIGYVKVTKHIEHYCWWVTDGELFDWTGIPLTEEEWATGKLSSGDMERSTGWTDRATALQQAARYFATRGYDGVRDGEHRRLILWEAANNLWWTWAAEDEDFVMEVLESINSQFFEAKPQEDLIKKMQEAHAITVGARRKVQTIGAYGWKREPSHSATEETIKALARKLKSRTNLAQVRVGDEMLRMIKGETIADDPAVWKSACTRVAHALAEQFSHDTKEKLAGFFDRSLKAMVATKNPTPDTEIIQTWVGLRLAQVRERWAENREKFEEKIKSEIEYVTAGARNTKYTKEEVDAWMGPHGPGLSARSWLVQVGKVTYVFVNGGYAGPYGESEFDAQGYIDLAPAIDFVRVRKEAKDGTFVNVRLKELLQQYGTQASTEIDYSCERTWFRKEDRTLCLAGPARNELQATFHAEVDEWLRRMGGRETPSNDQQRHTEAATSGTHDDYDAICNWLACITVLNRTCAALYLQGPTGVGKDMFGNGLAKIWKNGKITIEKALGKFNKGLTDTPFIHVNEGLPKGMSASVLLRRTLADVEHPYERKHVDAGKIKGCVRMLFTANNLNIFDEANDEKLQHEDTEALRDRFVHVRVRLEAASYLRSLGPKRADFVQKNMLAEHALWLHEKRWDAIKARDLRFLVEGKNHSVSNTVATNVGNTSEVCSVLAEAFSEAFITGRVQEQSWFAVRDGRLFVSSTGVRAQVIQRNPSVRASEREIALAVSSISEGAQSKKMLKIGGKRVKMWPVKIEALEAWCENARAFDMEDVLEGMIKFDKPFSQDEV